MPLITGIHHLSLSVTDLARSTAWYCDVLGFEEWSEVEGPTFRRVRLRQPETSVIVTLTCHDASHDSFDERRTGMDHVAFSAGTVADIEALEEHFRAHGAQHSPIRRGEGTAVITLRDPDNIQLEVFGTDG